MAIFEIQKLAGGRWVVDSLFDDRALAVEAARAIMGGSLAPAAIRVVEELEDGANGRVIFRQSAVDEANAEATRQAAEIRRAAEADRARRQAEKARARAKRQAPPAKPPKAGRLLIRLVAILAAGLAALVALELWLE